MKSLAVSWLTSNLAYMAFRLLCPLCGNSNRGWIGWQTPGSPPAGRTRTDARPLLARGRLRLRRRVQKSVVVVLDCREDTRRQALRDDEVLSPLVSRSGHPVSGG